MGVMGSEEPEFKGLISEPKREGLEGKINHFTRQKSGFDFLLDFLLRTLILTTREPCFLHFLQFCL